jgi:hypothetical protein
MKDDELVTIINHDLDLAIPVTSDDTELHALLAEHINHLVQKDFQRLINLLYRLDISETRLRTLLEQATDHDAGDIIASLIIERQLQKIKSRREFSQRDNNISEEEKW